VSETSSPPDCLKPAWRRTAAQVVDELFPVSRRDAWDDLLDLRQLLLHSRDWEAVLEGFLKCRKTLEEDHYLPFYRLRKILSAHLRLENAEISLETLLRKRNFSFLRWQKKAGHRSAEHGTSSIRLVEQH